MIKKLKIIKPPNGGKCQGQYKETSSKNPVMEEVYSTITSNKEYIRRTFNESADIVYYELNTSCRKMLIVYLDDLVNKEILNRDLIGALNNSQITGKEIKDTINIADVKESKYLNIAVDMILKGYVALFLESIDIAFLVPIQGGMQREIQEPSSEITSRGPKEGFVESLKTNRMLLRKKISNSKLVFEKFDLGRQTNTIINLVYIKGLAQDKILSELRCRLHKIDIDSIIDTEYIEELIKDAPYSPFNTVGYTERPDVLAAKLLEGRIGILCDGTPNVLTVPFLFIENIQVNEDYYNNFYAGSINRIIRYISFYLTTFIAGIYVALMSIHHESIPNKLLFSLIASRDSVPFPSIIEVLGMIVLFELLRESSLRMPKGLGQTVSIVGALVLGQAAVEARFISAPVVIIVAITAISSFIFYRINGAIMLLRFFVTLTSALMGYYGVIFCFIALSIHMSSIQSFGVPYMNNLVTIAPQEFKDSLIRTPWWNMKLRPKLISRINNRKRKS